MIEGLPGPGVERQLPPTVPKTHVRPISPVQGTLTPSICSLCGGTEKPFSNYPRVPSPPLPRSPGKEAIVQILKAHTVLYRSLHVLADIPFVVEDETLEPDRRGFNPASQLADWESSGKASVPSSVHVHSLWKVVVTQCVSHAPSSRTRDRHTVSPTY